ncbi:hypothetical protein V1521DRAFT_486214 [Lipomyces starkeyi]
MANFMAAVKQLNVEWCTDRIFTPKKYLISPSFWRMHFDCVRFSKIALDVLIEEAEAKAAGKDPRVDTIDEYVARNRFSRQFRDDYLVPMARLIWANEVGQSVTNKPDGTLAVVIKNPLDGTKKAKVFDHIILACHAPQPLVIIRAVATQLEKDILGVFKTTGKHVLLHEDASVMPRRRSAWGAETTKPKTALSHPNSTIGPQRPAGSISKWTSWNLNLATFYFLHTLSHPWYTPEAVANQEKMPLIQNIRGISYAGAWMAYGLHEDGFAAGLRCAIDHLGAEIPWRFQDARTIEGVVPTLTVRGHILRFILGIIQSIVLVFV